MIVRLAANCIGRRRFAVLQTLAHKQNGASPCPRQAAKAGAGAVGQGHRCPCRYRQIRPRASCGRVRGGREAPCDHQRSPCGRGSRGDGRGQGGWAGTCASCRSSNSHGAQEPEQKGSPATDDRRTEAPVTGAPEVSQVLPHAMGTLPARDQPHRQHDAIQGYRINFPCTGARSGQSGRNSLGHHRPQFTHRRNGLYHAVERKPVTHFVGAEPAR